MPTPEGLGPSIRSREIVFEADVTGVTPFLKLATMHRNGTGHMTFACDKGPSLGGLGNAERGCFVMQALLRPVPVTGRTLLNRAPPAVQAPR
jgi:hypothetical protein